MLLPIPCKLAFDHKDSVFRVFFPPKNEPGAAALSSIESPGTFQYSGYFCKGKFEHLSKHPSKVAARYREFVLSKPNTVTCVSVGLRPADFHQIVLEFDCKNEEKQKECETKAVAFLSELFERSDMTGAVEIYCLARDGGKDRTNGLQIIVPGTFIASLDHMTMLAVLKTRVPELNSALREWYLPFASNSADPTSIFYPYAAYYFSREASEEKIFTRDELLKTFLNVFGPAESGVWQFPTCSSETGEAVPILRAGTSFVGKTCSSLVPWNRRREMTTFLQFCDQNPDAAPCSEFLSYQWSALLSGRDFSGQDATFTCDITPLTVDDIRAYASRRGIINSSKVCQALVMGYSREVGRSIAQGLYVSAELYETAYRNYSPSGKKLPVRAAIQALVVDVYSDCEDEELDGWDGIPRSWNTFSGQRRLSALAVRQLTKGQATAEELAPFLLPALSASNGREIAYFDARTWSNARPVAANKLGCLLNCSEYVRERSSEDDGTPAKKKRKRRKTDYRQLLDVSMRYWTKYQTTDLPGCLFAFKNAEVYDFSISTLYFPLMCFKCAQRSHLQAIEFDNRDRKVYFSPDGALEDWPEISTYLMAVFGLEEADYFVDTVANLLASKNTQKSIYFFLGERGNNSKSTILDILCELFGGMCARIGGRTARQGLKNIPSSTRIAVLDEVDDTTSIKAALETAAIRNSRLEEAKPYTGAFVLAGKGLPKMSKAESEKLTKIYFKRIFTSTEELQVVESGIADAAKKARFLQRCRPMKSFTEADIQLLALQLFQLCVGRLRLEDIGSRKAMTEPQSFRKEEEARRCNKF